MMSEKPMINFDSSDWHSIRDTIDKVNAAGEMQVGQTEDGETIIFDVVADEEDGHDILKTSVFQDNGWTRTNFYDPAHYEIAETYKKES